MLDDSLYEIIWDENGTKYLGFLHDKNYYKDGEDVHYRFGIQESLAKQWISRLESQFNLSNKLKKTTI
jgi:hypothetical protein